MAQYCIIIHSFLLLANLRETAMLRAVLLLVCLVATDKAQEHIPSTHLDADLKFFVSWNATDDFIEFDLEVMAGGYVALGLSPNGGMAGSDIVIGWIKNGEIFLQDRYATGRTKPLIDASQDWILVSGSESDDGNTTYLSIRRKLDTCDEDDIKIDDSTMRLIYAYSNEDPMDEDDIMYHGDERGSKSVILLNRGAKELPELEDDTTYWDVLSPNFTIESSFSSKYWCKVYRAPYLEEVHHVVSIKPLITEGNERFVHHMLLYECVGATPEEYDPHAEHEGWQCRHPNMPDALKKCEGVYFAWGVGGNDLILPAHVGMPFGGGIDKYYMLEIHYDNQQNEGDIIDQSGLRIYYTHEKRKFDAGTLMIGSTVSPRLIIPPGRKDYIVVGHSNPDCLDPEIPEDGLKLLGTFLHAHLLGRSLKARHFRGKKELQPLAYDSNYDFNYQEYRYFSEEKSFLPGDQITVECSYDSSERNQTVLGGESTNEEMCIAFVLYYPRIERFASVSVPKLDLINKVLNTDFSKGDIGNGTFGKSMEAFDWSPTNTYDVEKEFRFGKHDTHCYLGNGEKNTVKSSITYPVEFEAFKTKSPCYVEEGLEVTTDQNRNSGCRKHVFELTLLISTAMLALILQF